jgi:hypothetical protein
MSIQIKLPFKATCINDKNIPKEIDPSKRIVQDREYTVVGLQHLLTKDEIGFILKEAPLDDSCFPYFYWSSNRFGIKPEELELEREEKKEKEEVCL